MRHLLLILLLAFGQVAQALHQVDHVADNAQAECQLCLQAHAAHPHPPLALASPTFVAQPPIALFNVAVDLRSPANRAWLARAPPVLH